MTNEKLKLKHILYDTLKRLSQRWRHSQPKCSQEVWNRTEEKGLKCETLAAWMKVQNAIRGQEPVSDGRWSAGRVEKNCIDIQRCTGPCWNRQCGFRVNRVYPRLGIDFCWGRQKVSGVKELRESEAVFPAFIWWHLRLFLRWPEDHASLEVLPICKFPRGKRKRLLNSNVVIGKCLQHIIINKKGPFVPIFEESSFVLKFV